MRGTILGYDTTLHTGAIAGFDGQRYIFVRLDWRGADIPAAGLEVDFVRRGEEAAAIYPVPAMATALHPSAAYAPAGYSPQSIAVLGPPFNWRDFLFSFNGRIGRKSYLVRWVLLSWVLELIAWAIDYWYQPFEWTIDLGYFTYPVSAISSGLWLIMLWPHVATLIKRLHDRGHSGWFSLVALIPIIGAIWLWIETWFLPSTPGPNIYGEGPMADPI